MDAIVTPRLVLVPTPLAVIATRLERADFYADVPVSIDGEMKRENGPWLVHFPPEWPGDAVVLLPAWKSALESNPEFEMLGGTMIERIDRVAIGQMTISRVTGAGDVFELGYGVIPWHQGRGYATEAARALVPAVARRPEVRRIIASCLAENRASIRVLEKSGFHRTGERVEEERLLISWEYSTPSAPQGWM